MGGTRKKKEKEKCHRERERQTEREKERGKEEGLWKKTGGKKAVQTFLTSLGQKFSSPSLHFVLHFCVLKTFFSCFTLLVL